MDASQFPINHSALRNTAQTRLGLQLLYPCALLRFQVPVLQDLIPCFSLSLLSPGRFNGPVCIWTPEHTGIFAGPRKDKLMHCYCWLTVFKLILAQRQRKVEEVWIIFSVSHICHTPVHNKKSCWESMEIETSMVWQHRHKALLPY